MNDHVRLSEECKRNQVAIETILRRILYIINISQISHYGYYMINSFNKYLLRVYYLPGGKFNARVQALSPNPM